MPTSLLDAEHTLQDALRTRDVATLDALLDDRVRYVGPDGGTMDKAADLEAHRSGALRLDRVEELEVEAQVFDGAGITRVVLALSGEDRGIGFEATMTYTRTWCRSVDSPTGWVVVAAHASVRKG
ncbi:MAG TPA: nuclear transport factor 2 family protein [Cellulomonas sp.]